VNLRQALRSPAAPCLALVGAGGKTTALFQLARQYPAALVTTTTHLATSQAAWADQHIRVEGPADVPAPGDDLPVGVSLFTGAESADRLEGCDPVSLERLHALAKSRHLPLLIEADGARLRPLKAPAAHEPAIPPWVDGVMVVAGLSALGQPLTTDWVHRPDRFTALSGLAPGANITPEAIARVLTHPDGGLKHIPSAARPAALLNQADTPELQAQAAKLSAWLLPAFGSAIIASLAAVGDAPARPVVSVVEPVAGIVLAAGGSARLGRPKPLLDWQGEPFVRCVARTALEAGLSPVVVVVGADAGLVRAALGDLRVASPRPLEYPTENGLATGEPGQRPLVVENPGWADGQSTSIRVGLGALVNSDVAHEPAGAAVFLLADQPQSPATLVRALVERHAQTLTPIVAPLVDGQRGNPVLFDRGVFPDLLALTGDVGGRALFARYPVEWLPWHDARLLLDVDTPEDYDRLRDMGQV
jgi:molybdenum cofactor cytidylyltransferase